MKTGSAIQNFVEVDTQIHRHRGDCIKRLPYFKTQKVGQKRKEGIKKRRDKERKIRNKQTWPEE
jgi:hypothetical protein